MKIHGLGALHTLQNTPRAERTQDTGAPARTGAVKTSLSTEAAWLNAVRAEARQPPQIRSELVDSVRAELDAGTFEQNVDMDHVLDGLLAEF
jgi:hypothetical protein